MQITVRHQEDINRKGFTIVNDIYTGDEVNAIVSAIEKTDQSNPSFRKTKDLFAIRRFLVEVPAIKPLVFSERLTSAINQLLGEDYFAVKSIYFDKPAESNWFVAWHQDLTIAVDRKADLPGYGTWTVKQDQFAVQPPIEILQRNFTIRIHLDDTDRHNGALKVIPGSHLKSVYRAENIDWQTESEVICEVRKGGVMIMKPLLLHASDRTTNDKKRRVIHLEFSNAKLPDEIKWAES
jgi:ectoine hydroxylase-related dioxygenase (phytanoyl-CoA dioxygenase family)